MLKDGDILSIISKRDMGGIPDYKLVYTKVKNPELRWEKIALGKEIQKIAVGRGKGDFLVEDDYISEHHASFFQGKDGWSILDFGSTNGVIVNNERIQGGVLLRPMDVIRMGNTWFFFQGKNLWIGRIRQESRLDAFRSDELRPDEQRTDALGYGGIEQDDIGMNAATGYDPDHLIIDIEERNVWSRFKKKTLLKDIHLTVEPGDFVLILGGSGAGKTTFMNAVMGYEKAEGTIKYGDLDIYEEYEEIKYNIGFVPQQDTMRMNDTVYNVLYGAAQMKVRDTEICEERCDWAISLLGLEREQSTLVGKLSGGQKKRLSIAMELVGNPALFFLDEPDSGLDGIMARELLQNLKEIADMGKMVMMITHGPDRGVDLFTKVLVLATGRGISKSGHSHAASFWFRNFNIKQEIGRTGE
ncbi:MAG: ATP-binding cassette domain-containing protein [Hespellia sp.]|nr:ATP-binding cassette domain-containing protein [Hespellia sp.]